MPIIKGAFFPKETQHLAFEIIWWLNANLDLHLVMRKIEDFHKLCHDSSSRSAAIDNKHLKHVLERNVVVSFGFFISRPKHLDCYILLLR